VVFQDPIRKNKNELVVKFDKKSIRLVARNVHFLLLMQALTINKTIETIFQLLFLNVFVSPLFWIFLPSVIAYFPSIPISGFCYIFGFLCFLVARIRKRKLIVDWTREIIIVTGGSHGIGARLCELLIEEGAQVVIIDRMKPMTSV
jgi:3-oxoacyl-ACP reductase-like protein